MTLEEKIEKYCTCCGTQRCIPWNKEDRMGCPHFNPKVKAENDRMERWIETHKEELKEILNSIRR